MYLLDSGFDSSHQRIMKDGRKVQTRQSIYFHWSVSRVKDMNPMLLLRKMILCISFLHHFFNGNFIIALFDEQYVDYGMNKLIWIFRLREEDYEFKVLLHSFCVHVPHPTYEYELSSIYYRTTLSGDMTYMRNQGKLTKMDLIMKEYLKGLKQKGKELKTMLPLCENVKSSGLWGRLTEL